MHKRGSFYDVVTVEDCQIVDADYRLILKAVRDYFAELLSGQAVLYDYGVLPNTCNAFVGKIHPLHRRFIYLSFFHLLSSLFGQTGGYLAVGGNQGQSCGV